MNTSITHAYKLDQLTGLRYFAALLVFLSHSQWDGSNLFFRTIFEQGYVGVSFFFMLSGFILSHSYGRKIKSGILSFPKYIFLRLARLTPLHFLMAIPFIVTAIYKSDLELLKVVINLTYLQSWIPNSSYYFSLNAPSWSLSNEMFFYLCFFGIISFTHRKTIYFTLLLLTVISIFAIIVTISYNESILYGKQSIAHWMFYIFPGFRIIEFLIGMILYRLWEIGIRLNKLWVLPAYIMLLVAMYFAGNIPEAFRFSLYYIPFIMLFFYIHLSQNLTINKFYSSRLMIILGNSSFALYLIHQPLITIIKRLLRNQSFTNTALFFITIVAITIISIAVYVLYERKAETYLKSSVNKKFP